MMRVGASALLVLTSGCGFEPREGEPPFDIPPECVYSEATEDRAVIAKLITAFECSVDGIDAFRNLHMADFVFTSLVLSPAESEQLSGIAIGDKFATQIQGTEDLGYEQPLLSVTIGDEEIEGDATVFRNAPYTLEFQGDGLLDVKFSGIATITVRPEGAGFYVTRWEDGEGALGERTIGEFYLNGTELPRTR